MVSIELHETYKWNTMIIKINKSEFHLLLTIRSICSRLLKITTAFSGFLVRGCNSKAVVNKESMQQVFPHLQPHHPLDFWTLEGTQKTQWFWIESPEFEKGFFTLINFFLFSVQSWPNLVRLQYSWVPQSAIWPCLVRNGLKTEIFYQYAKFWLDPFSNSSERNPF